tara:strand:+ start:1326 stop:1547 length:222 start_codon:yes stop_codon:yes gene_type:complete
MIKVRMAIVSNADLETVRAYLPSNYEAYQDPFEDHIVINGVDRAGWTLDRYVIPRLASGLIVAREFNPDGSRG